MKNPRMTTMPPQAPMEWLTVEMTGEELAVLCKKSKAGINKKTGNPTGNELLFGDINKALAKVGFDTNAGYTLEWLGNGDTVRVFGRLKSGREALPQMSKV